MDHTEQQELADYAASWDRDAEQAQEDLATYAQAWDQTATRQQAQQQQTA